MASPQDFFFVYFAKLRFALFLLVSWKAIINELTCFFSLFLLSGLLLRHCLFPGRSSQKGAFSKVEVESQRSSELEKPKMMTSKIVPQIEKAMPRRGPGSLVAHWWRSEPRRQLASVRAAPPVARAKSDLDTDH